MPKSAATLYHYTDAGGAVGIVSNLKLWLSDYRSLNDRAEVNYSISLIRETLKEAYSENYFKEFLDRIDWESQLFDNLVDCISICSFSEKRDDPVLWRIYSANNGYCIGFDRAILLGLTSGQGATLGKVIYRRGDQKAFIKKSFKEFCETDSVMKKQLRNVGKFKELDGIFAGINFFFWAYGVAPLMKDASFAHEKEWRLFRHIRNESELKFRVRRDIVPYVEIELKRHDAWRFPDDQHWLKSLDFGPGETEINFAQYILLIRAMGFNDKKMTFRRASIPLRIG